MNLGELKTAIRANTHRPSLSDSDLERHIDATMIAVGRDAELFKQEKSVSVASNSDGLAPADIASDFLREVSVYYDDGGYNRPLTKYTLSQINTHFYRAEHTPIAYYWEAAKLKIAPYQDQTLVVVYKQRIPLLSNDSSTNDYLTDWPEVFEYGATYRAGLQYQDDDVVNYYKPLYDEQVMNLKKYADLQQYRGANVKAVM